MNFGIITQNQNMVKKQNCVIGYCVIIWYFDTVAYRKNKKVTGLMKDELGGHINKFIGLRPKTYSYLKDNNDEGKKAKGPKKCHKKLSVEIIRSV